MIREYTSWFENLDIYQEWMKNLPEPFNNAAFASAVFLGVVFFLLTAIVDRILLVRWNARQRKARRRREEQRRQEMEEQRERERHSRADREQMDLYLRFLMTAQMQNFTSLQGITFGQWKSQMLAEKAACGAGCGTGSVGERTEEEAGKETGADAGGKAEPAEKAETDAVELSGMLSEPAGICAEAALESASENENPDMGVRAVQTDGSCYLKRNMEGISLLEKQNALETGIPSQENGDAEIPVQEMSVGRGMGESGLMPEEEPVLFTGEFGLPVKRIADNAAGESAGPGTSAEVLRSACMAAVMEQIRKDGDSGTAGELSPGQQDDFARVLAQMREDARQQDYLERFQREKSEIIRNNLSVLDKSVSPFGENSTEGKDVERKTAAEEEMERRKEAAREAIRQAGRLEQEKGKKKGLFGRRK